MDCPTHLSNVSPGPSEECPNARDGRNIPASQLQELRDGLATKPLTVNANDGVEVKTTTVTFESSLYESPNTICQDSCGALTGLGALRGILEREQWNKFGFVLFRTFYQDEMLWQQFLQEYESILRNEVKSAGPSIESDEILSKIQVEIVSDDCMENQAPEYIALVYRIFNDIHPGLRTKMCLIVDKECMESVIDRNSHVPFVKAVDVILGADLQSAFPRVMKVAISSLLARFYPALANCDTVWEIALDPDVVWLDWPCLEDGVE